MVVLIGRICVRGMVKFTEWMATANEAIGSLFGFGMGGGTISSSAATAAAPQGRGIPLPQQQQANNATISMLGMELDPQVMARHQQEFELQILEQRLVQLQQRGVLLLGYPPHPHYPNHAGGAVDPQQQQHQQQRHLIRNSMLLGSGGQDGGRGVVSPGGGSIHRNPRLNIHHQSDSNNRVSSSLLHQPQFQQQPLPMDPQSPNTKLINKPTIIAAVSAPAITEQEQQQVADAAQAAGTETRTNETVAAAAAAAAATTVARSNKDVEGGTIKKRKKTSTTKRQQRDQQKTMRKKQKSYIRTSRNTAARDDGGDDVDADGLLRQVMEEAKSTVTINNQDGDTVEGATNFTTTTCSSVGQDGNFDFCKSCGETGEVVCCDACPHVYHPQCLPKDCESFAALDNQDDDEPWYCPLCIKNGYSKENKKKTSKKGANTSSAATCRSPYRQNRPKRKRSHDADDEANEDETRATTEEDTVMTPSENAIRKNRQGLRYGESKSIVEKVRHCTKDDDDENDENEFLPSKVTPAPSAVATNSDQMMNSNNNNKNNKNNHDGNNDAEDDVAVAAVKKRKSDNQSRNISPKKKSKSSIQENNNKNIINVDDDDTDDGIHGDDDGDDDSDRTNNHPRRNDHRAAAKGKKKYIDDDNDDDDVDDDDDNYYDNDNDNDDDDNDDGDDDNSVVVMSVTTLTNRGENFPNKGEQKWMETYERLVKYKKKYKSTCVPTVYPADPQLGRWVTDQRVGYNSNQSNLSVDRITQLKSIGFVWNIQDAQWMEKYERLVEYKKQNKSTCVPNRYPADPQLGNWVREQRKSYNANKSKLTTDRITQLDSIGFVWNPRDAQWAEKYDRLVKYKKRNKTTCVPISYPADPQLGIWVSTQRLFYNTNRPSLTADRITQLESIGFVWKIT